MRACVTSATEACVATFHQSKCEFGSVGMLDAAA